VIPTVLTIAGTDPSAGAGIAADLKTFAALGAYGTLVVTAVTAQSTRGVDAVLQLDGAFVEQQLETLLADVRVDAVKIGMLGSADVARAVAAVLRRHRLPHVVLDPVMVATSGDRLLAADAVAALREELLPLADLLTPNVPEAADLLGVAEARDTDELEAQARDLARHTARVLLKGGHLGGPESVDLLVAGDAVVRLAAPRIPTTSTHGTGCTLSSAVAALRPAARDWETAVRGAKDYLTGALRAADGLSVGQGHGPLHHFHALWPPAS
jgi:hydroxymethylpyrimidine/phosphomethylpyrimidine kinase